MSGLRDIQYPDVPFNSQIYNQNDWKNVIYTSIYNKLSSEYNIILGTYERKELIENFDTTIFKNIQRIFIMGLYNKGLIDFLHSKGKLVVVYNNFDKSLNTCSVSTDERNKAKLIVDHLIKIGHKKIAAINGDMNFSESIERSMGFQEALMKNSVPVELSMIKWGNMTSESGYHLAKQILSGKEKPTAIVCVNDNVASGALFAAKEIGLSCPKDISIVGHDFNSLLHEHTDPIITSISPQYELVGEKISEKLIRDIWFDDSTIVEGKLALTESIAPPPIKAP